MPVKKGQILNPTGKGGFQERMDDINLEGRPKHTPVFWMNQYGKMTEDEFIKEVKKPRGEKTVNQLIAQDHIVSARSDLATRRDLINRVDGMPSQRHEVEGDVTHHHINYDEVLQLIHDQRTIIESEKIS